MSGLESSSEHIRSSCEGSSTSSSTIRPTCTCDTPSKPSAGSARSTAWPCGSRMPSFGRMRTRARTSGFSRCAKTEQSKDAGSGEDGSPSATEDAGMRRFAASPAGSRLREPGVERLAGDALVGLLVALARALDHVLGDLRRRRRLVPAGAGRPVAHELLVEARLRAARLVCVRRPEARGVRGEHLVADDDATGLVTTELELRVGQDDPALARVVGRERVELDREPAQFLERLAVAEDLGGTVEVDVLVVVADVG